MKITDLLNGRYINAAYLADGKPRRMIIKSLESEQLGPDRETKAVLRFYGETKGLPLNKINTEALAELFGAIDTDELDNKEIVLVRRTTDSPNGKVPAVRILTKSLGATSEEEITA